MRPRYVLVMAAVTAGCCWGDVQFPTYPYILPAIAETGGPVFIIPGTVTEASSVGFTASGTACLKSSTLCMNAAGITTVSTSGTGKTYTFNEKIGASSGTWNLGAILISIEGVGTRQVFQATIANGLNQKSPTTTLPLSQTTFAALGFPNFSTQNARITFFVADNYYPDNLGSFLLTLQSPTLTYNTSTPTQKVIQVVGPCDWVAWKLGQGPCNPTAAAGHPSQILGMDLGYSFEDKKSGNLIFLFGDTIGVQIPSGTALNATVQSPNQFPAFNAADAIARAADTSTAAQFPLAFFEVPGSSPAPHVPDAPVFVTPTEQPGIRPLPVSMGPDDVPTSGIHLNGKNYIIVNTGAHTNISPPNLFEYSVLVQYVSNTNFTSGRTISIANTGTVKKPIPAGHFVFTALQELPLSYAQQLGLSEPAVLIFGNAQYRGESIYLAYMPASEFWRGTDSAGNSATRYFKRLDADGRPIWTPTQLAAMPVVYDNPTGLQTIPDPGRAGNTSVSYNSGLGLWLMTWDGGRQTDATTGIYLSYASAPWGPWSTPKLIYNACDAHTYGQGYGDFIRYTYGAQNAHNAPDICGTHVGNSLGPVGPMIGTAQDPFYGSSKGETATSRRGAVYAPFQIARFATVQNNLLTIYFHMSTWNPYTIVLMESSFTIAP